VTEHFPRAPRFRGNSCILTPALLESAQRVFLWHSPSPIHWMDLSTLIETIVIYDNIAYPVVHAEYAAPLFDPLSKSGIADPWYPEAGILGGSTFKAKEEVWAEDGERVENGLRDARGAIKVMSGWWPDANYDALSDVSQKAINGIAHGFSEAALGRDNNELSVLLWGTFLREESNTTYEATAEQWLQKGVARIAAVPTQERVSYSVPHVTNLDVYNHYASHLRILANDNRATIVKSLVEQPYFDSVSVEMAAKDTLQLLLRTAFEKSVTEQVGKYIKVLPISPFAAIALSKATNVDEALSIAVDLRDEFKAYRKTLTTYRQALSTIETSQTLESIREVRRIESSFEQALSSSLKRIGAEYMTNVSVFDPVSGIEKVAKSVITGEYASLLDKLASQVIGLIKGWAFMNYGGVYDMVSHFPKVQQLNRSAYRLIKKELDSQAIASISDAVARLTKYHRLPVANS
jgi:hypothetical protein